MILRYVLITIISVTSLDSYSQDNERWFVSAQIGFDKITEIRTDTLYPSGGSGSLYLDTQNSFSLGPNAVFGYNLIENRLTLGVGIGINWYNNPDFTAIPLYADLRFYFLKYRNFYILLDYGAFLRLNGQLVRGPMLRFGAGYRKEITDNINFLIDANISRAGISFTDEQWTTSSDAFASSGVALNLGVQIKLF